MVIKLPFPSSELMPNRKNGKSWHGSQAAKATARDDAYYATKEAMGAWKPSGDLIPVSIVFVPPDKRHRDLDNLLAAAKAQLDGVAMALGVDDKRFRPILLDVVAPSKLGAMLVAVGVEIRSGVNL